MQPAGDAEGPAPAAGQAPFALRLEAILARLIPGFPAARCAVALSGGVDSVVLLHALAALAAGQPLLRLRALHVHHGLQPAADDWVAACRAHCTRLGVPLEVIRLGLRPARGASHEAEAREARYAALAGRLEAGECLLTAHHQDDQLETLLLQLLRGAGVPGLAAMPAVADLGAGLHVRPLLDTARAELADYARAHGLSWVEDPMNTAQRYDRAYLRSRVLPALRERWPAAGATLGRAARHLAEAQRLLESLAAHDAGPLLGDGRLDTAGLLALPRERQANVVRWWLSAQGLGAPSAPRLAAILDNVVPARPDATPVVTWPSGEVRRYRGRLYAMHPLGPEPTGEWPLSAAAPTTIAGSGEVALEPTDGPGLARDRLALPLTIRFRQGGETLRVAGNPLAKPLQRWFQEAGVPPWLRSRIPLVYAGQDLVAVGDRWVAAAAAAAPGEPAWKIGWRPIHR